MNKSICKVNKRCITLCVFVTLILLTQFSSQNIFAEEIVPIELPETPIPTPTLSSTDYLLEQEENKFLDDSYGGYRSNFEKSLEKSKSTQRSLLDIYLNALGGIRSAVTTFSQSNPTPTPTSIPSSSQSGGISSELHGIIPTGSPPAGRCTDVVNDAIANLKSKPANIEVYRQASSQTGVPWEVIAAIHYVETGGDFDPSQNLQNGNPLNGKTLLTSAVQAGFEYLEKEKIAASIYGISSDVSSTYSPRFQRIAQTFALYNGPGNVQCKGAVPKPQSKYPGCPAKFDMEDHVYPMGCFDISHEHMWIIYCGDGAECAPISTNNPNGNEYKNRVGALTLIRGIQKVYTQSPGNVNYTPGPTHPPPAGLLKSPLEAETIAFEMKRRCDTGGNRSYNWNGVQGTYLVDSINSNNYNTCVAPLTSATDGFKERIRLWLTEVSSNLQCVGLAHAFATEINGSLGKHPGNANQQAYTGGNLNNIPPPNMPYAGDMVVFSGSGWSDYGHIAYISQLPFGGAIKVVEANMNGRGSVSIGTYSSNNPTIRGFLRKKM